MKNFNWKLVLDKVGTVIIDRRFWVSLFSVIVLVFGTDQMLGNVDALSDQAVELSSLLLKFMGVFVVPVLLGNSWTKRAPSGLGFKEVNSEVEAFVKTLSETISKES